MNNENDISTKEAENSKYDIYPIVPTQTTIAIERIITLFYFEYTKDFVYRGETHDFWELLFVDKGQVEVMADTEGYQLEQGDIIFHKPNEFHSIWANGKIAPNLIVATFVSESPSMQFFENKILKVKDDEKSVLAKMIQERARCINKGLDEDFTMDDIKADEVFGAQQLIKIYLQILLISLVRNNTAVNHEERISLLARHRVEDDIVKRMINFMNENIGANLSLDDFSKEFALSRTRLKSLFHENMDTSIIHFFRCLKIEKAKDLMREKKYNFTEIAEILGFSSISYFSNVFSQIAHMTPTEYITSVKFKSESANL